MESRNFYIGTWEVSNCEYLKEPIIGFDRRVDKIEVLKGIKLRLDENGDVTWTVPEELKSVPLFSCETFEVYKLNRSYPSLVLRFGAYAGHVFEFLIDAVWAADNMQLTCEGICTLHCVRIKDECEEMNYNVPFTLLPALEDGYFSDVTITSSNKKQFKVHSTILELQGDDIDWTTDPPPFNNFSEEVLSTILQFMYVECLPENLTEETARQVITATSSYPSLNKLVESCELFLKNMALKQQIIGLVNDMHSCINQIIEKFQSRGNHSSPENIASNPAKLCFVVKQSIRDAAVAGAKLLLLCDLFTKRKNELTRNERHEIIRYAKSRLPVFLNQLTRFLQALKNTFSSFSPAQRVEIATFLVPEIEVILDTISMLILHVEQALKQIVQGMLSSDESKCKSNVGDMMSKTLRNILHIRELTKLNTLHEHITCSLGLLIHKKENFNQMSSSQKVRSIARTLEQLIEELPIFLIKLEEASGIFDDKLEWRDFKFCFKVATSKVSDILQKLLTHTDSLQDVMMQVCELVQRDAFTQTLQCLGLLNTAVATAHSTETPKITKSSSFSVPKQNDYKFNLVKSLCTPVDPSKSLLSELCLLLLNSQKKSDMEFEIIGNPSSSQTDSTESEEKCIIKSHRVIVAARCDWFRRALLSGMREAIDKKIIIHDTSPSLFKLFLEYLYSGRLLQSSLSTEQLIDLLLLSDRYEMDTLKHTCEYALLNSLDTDSVLYFVSMADQYNAAILKTQCFTFISKHYELTDSEEFLELPISLQAEIFETVWTTQPTLKPSETRECRLKDIIAKSSASSLASPDVANIRSAMESMLLTPDVENESSASSPEETWLEQNSERMESFISDLKDIVGESAPRDRLIQVILAADFDLTRAVNYYFTMSDNDE